MNHDWFAAFAQVVWTVSAEDPTRVLDHGSGPLKIAETALPEVALAAGIGFDYLAVPDPDEPTGRYEWHLVVPAEAHLVRTKDDIPVGVATVLGYLKHVLPAETTNWLVEVDEHSSLNQEYAAEVRDQYHDFIGPLETGIRSRHADRDLFGRFAPVVHRWGLVGQRVVCTMNLAVADIVTVDGDEAVASLDIGCRIPDEVLAAAQWADLETRGLSSKSPVFLLPRPLRPLFMASPVGYGRDAPPDWVGFTPEEVAGRVVGDHERVWFPRWQERRPGGSGLFIPR